MINFLDSLGYERAVEFSLSHCGHYINLTLFAKKNTNGSTVQIPIELVDELIDNLTETELRKHKNVSE